MGRTLARYLVGGTTAALTLGFLSLVAPTTSAHQDNCTVNAHAGGFQFHLACFSAPHTCFVNAQATGSIQAHVLCDDPENHPCLVKAQAEGQTVRCPEN